MSRIQYGSPDEYEKREREIHEADLRRINSAKPKDAREAQARWIQHCKTDPELVAERVSWILAGHYGKGAYDAAWRLVLSEFVKPTIGLIELVGQLEWLVPRRYILAGWTKIPASAQAELHAKVREASNEARIDRETSDS